MLFDNYIQEKEYKKKQEDMNLMCNLIYIHSLTMMKIGEPKDKT